MKAGSALPAGDGPGDGGGAEASGAAGAHKALSGVDYRAIGERLKAYRVGASLLAEDVAERLGVSRAVVYRMEKGDIVKIETLESLAQLLGTTLASLLGVEVEYYPTALGLFERMRQLELGAERILAHFEPISVLLTSDQYLGHLRQMLVEGAPRVGGKPMPLADIDNILAIMAERKAHFERRRPHILSLIGLRELERFVLTGLVGRVDLPEPVRAQRVEAARHEVRRIADLMESEPLHVQIGLIDDAMPSSTFQLFAGPERNVVAVSPFRLGELPNVRNGIATVTASPEATAMHEAMIARLWKQAYKGKAGAQMLRQLVERIR
ncbi:helix-turn-helix transcriptional regulator [Variovorax sp.]|uniref:helix-turn-helix domain-containing protein n=1 Tax=Variovorax sp. TaxID=1871043 RepID=UPI002D7091D3|nr:helix-turn-helix transcriptional regulator [Variovorax sp.]HYP85203.1 helix-turn-helix transcriptional regulator [Variovorax sp.]